MQTIQPNNVRGSMTRNEARRQAAYAIEAAKPHWRHVADGTCVGEAGEGVLLVRVQDVKTIQNPKGRPQIFAFHRAIPALFGYSRDGFMSGEVRAARIESMPPPLRAAIVVGLASDPAGLAFIRKEPALPYTPRFQENYMAPPPSNGTKTTTAPVVTVRRDEKRMVLVQRTFTAEIPVARLLDLVRSAGADIPADAQVQVVWADRDDKPYLGRTDSLAVTWSRSEETVEH